MINLKIVNSCHIIKTLTGFSYDLKQFYTVENLACENHINSVNFALVTVAYRKNTLNESHSAQVYFHIARAS